MLGPLSFRPAPRSLQGCLFVPAHYFQTLVYPRPDTGGIELAFTHKMGEKRLRCFYPTVPRAHDQTEIRLQFQFLGAGPLIGRNKQGNPRPKH